MMGISKWKLVTWGAKHHPGNGIYLVMSLLSFIAFIDFSLILAFVINIGLAVFYIVTSYEVGKANIERVENCKP